jgi:hypothetical protein
VPDVIAHVYGDVPPVAAIVAEYAVPFVPAGRDDVVIVTVPDALTTKLNVADAVRDAASVN